MKERRLIEGRVVVVVVGFFFSVCVSLWTGCESGWVARSEALGPRLFEEVRLERIEPEIEQSPRVVNHFVV